MKRNRRRHPTICFTFLPMSSAAGGWPDDLTWPNTETLPPLSDTVDEDSSLEGIPALEDIPEEIKRAPRTRTVLSADEEDGSVTGMKGIAPFEWDALERVAVEEALEHEERTRKIFRRSKKEKIATFPNEATKKVEELNQAALQKAEQLHLARKKAIVSWRNAVTATFHQVVQNSSTSVELLQDILEHSPLLQEYEKASPLEPHLEEFLPLLVKNRNKGQSARLCLARFILRLRPLLLLTPIPTIGRSVLHVASWWGDCELVNQICNIYKEMKEHSQKGKEKSDPSAKQYLWPEGMKSLISLDETCHESGLNPVHYAAISGNLVVLEILMRAGCKVDTRTNASHTWSRASGHGITAQELVQGVLSKTNDVETLGTAYFDIVKEHKYTQKLYAALLTKISLRLKDVANGRLEHTTVANIQQEAEAIHRQIEKEDDVAKKDDVSTTNSSTNDTSAKSTVPGVDNEQTSESGIFPGKRVRKKKKKKPQEDTKSEDDKKPSAVQSTMSSLVHREDPVVTALLGMGFEREQVQTAINACGGHARATVDNAVAWIFGQQENSDNAVPPARHETATSNQDDAWNSKQPKKKESKPVESLRVNEKAVVPKDDRVVRNREWPSRPGVAAKRPESKPPKPTKSAFPPLVPEKLPDSRKPPPSFPKVREEQVAGTNNATLQESATASSSIEHRTIEIFNDDATVSTLGSIATRSTIVPHSNAPPGFHVPPTMFEEPLSSSWNQNTFGNPSYGSSPPPAISESMVMQSLGLHRTPVAANPPPVYRSPIEHQPMLDPHHQLLTGYNNNLHLSAAGAGDSHVMLGGLNQRNSHFGAGRLPTHHPPPHHSRPSHEPSHPHHHYDPGFVSPSTSSQYPFIGSNSHTSFRNDNTGLGNSLFPSSNAPDPLTGLRSFVAPEANDFALPLGLGLAEGEGTSLWDNSPADHVDNGGLGVTLFGLSNDDKKRPPNWSGDGLGGSIW